MAEEMVDFFYRVRGEIEQLSDELMVPEETSAKTAEKVQKVRLRLGKLADEMFEHYLDALSRKNIAEAVRKREAPGGEATDRG